MIGEKNSVHSRAQPQLICVETEKPPYSTLLRYHTEVDLRELERYGDLEPLIANLMNSKGASLEGEHLYDLVDHKALIRLNFYANGVKKLPTKIWLY